MNAPLKAAIAGGGIGGLAVATALASRGWDVVVFEKQPQIRTSGSGIYIWENGLRVLSALGAHAITDDAFRGYAFEQRDCHDQVIDAGVLPEDVRLVTIPRGHLLEGLRQAAIKAGAKLRTGVEVVGGTAHGALTMASGNTEHADLVVGADGVWSTVRRSLGLEAVHEQTLEGGIRAIIQGTQDDLGPDGRGRYIEVWHDSRRLLITPISRSQIYLALTCMKGDRASDGGGPNKRVWCEAFPRWAHLIERIDGWLPWSPYSIVKVSTWSAGRAAILGDAAHAQPPNLGQGAGMAMQSALSLSMHLSGVTSKRELPERLAAWEADGRPLVDHCQKWSCLYGELAFLPDKVRSGALARLMADPWVIDQLQRAAKSLVRDADVLPRS